MGSISGRLGVSSMMTSEQYNLLHQNVKAEVERRNACGSLEVYRSQITVSGQEAKPGETILTKHGKQVIEPLLAIQDYGDLVFPEPGAVIPTSFDESLITYVNELSKESMTGATTSCRGACTGLCMNGCSNACSGCTEGCTGCGGCSGSCGTGCASGSRA